MTRDGVMIKGFRDEGGANYMITGWFGDPVKWVKGFRNEGLKIADWILKTCSSHEGMAWLKNGRLLSGVRSLSSECLLARCG